MDPGTAKVAATTVVSPLLNASMYWRTATIGSFVLISAAPFFGAACAKPPGQRKNLRASAREAVIESPSGATRTFRNVPIPSLWDGKRTLGKPHSTSTIYEYPR